jgi:hypothetical protein
MNKDKERLSNYISRQVKIKILLYQSVEVRETSKFPHFPDNRLTDGGEVISLTRSPTFTDRNVPDISS